MRPSGRSGPSPAFLRHVDVPIAHEQQRREEVDGGEPQECAGVRRTVHPVAAVPAELRARERGDEADEQQQGDRLAHPGGRDVLRRREAVLMHERLIGTEHGAGDAQTGEAPGQDRPVRQRSRTVPPTALASTKPMRRPKRRMMLEAG